MYKKLIAVLCMQKYKHSVNSVGGERLVREEGESCLFRYQEKILSNSTMYELFLLYLLISIYIYIYILEIVASI